MLPLMPDSLFSSNPYENLYIYYLQGTIAPEALDMTQEAFIGNWEEDGFSFLFFSSPALEPVEALIGAHPGLSLIDTYEMTCEQWHGDKIESYTVGNLCISPPWKIPFVNRSGIRHLLLDPGVVFGTGRHPTTEACLEAMEALFADERISTMIDIGCGTGLLSLGAAALGCARVLALDYNLLAVRTTLRNVRLNSFEQVILPIQAKGQEFSDCPADLMVANIHYDVMKDLIETPGFLEKRWFILSGLLKSEAEKILASLAHKPVRILETRCSDGVWNTIVGKPV